MAAVEGPSSSTDEVFPGRKAIGIYEQIKTLAPGNQALEIQIVRKKGSFLEGFAEYFTKSNRALEPRYLRKVYYCGALVNGRPSADQERLLREATILRNMDHPNIVRYEDFEWLPTVADKAFLYMEYCQTGDLASYLASQPKADVPLSKNHFWQIFNQLSSALLYCHTGLKAWEEREIWREPLWREPVYHRDVKEANVVISSINEHDIRVKLCDFGFAKGASSNVAGSFVGSRGYIAPEITEEHRDWTPKADIYSLGMTMKKLLARIEGIPQETQDTATEILQKCESIDPGPRPLAIDLLDWTRAIVYPENYDSTTLHIAASRGDLNMVKYIVNLGANPSATTLLGQTPLQVAAVQSHSKVVEYLSGLESSTNLTATSNGYNLLHLAAWNGDAKLTKRLIKAKEDASLATSEGWTPLHLAAQNGHLLVVQMLLNVPVEPEPSSTTGFLPLHLAAQNGHAAVVTQLLPLTKDINAACEDSRTPLILAKANGQSHVVKILTEGMSNLNVPESPSGSTRPNLSDDSDSTLESVKDKGHKHHQTVLESNRRKLIPSLSDHQPEKHQRIRGQLDLIETQPQVGSEEKNTISDVWIARLSEVVATLTSARARPRRDAVRIGILTSGIDERVLLTRQQISAMRSFVMDEVTDNPDRHGTHTAGLLLRLAPYARLHIAKIASDQNNSLEPSVIAKATRWMIDEKVDLIIMPLGFQNWDKELDQAIGMALGYGVLVFAAASNSGSNFEVAWPARKDGVIAFNSTDGYGNASHFNPAPKLESFNFATLGEAVQSDWPLKSQSDRRSSGSSTSVVIGAAIAATILQVVQDRNIDPERYHRLHTSEGMGRVLKRLGREDRSGYTYVSLMSIYKTLDSSPEIELFNIVRDSLS